MNNQSYEITVDTRKSISHSNIEFAQNNLNISELIFNITEDEKAFPLNDTDKIIVYFEKPDKTVVFQDKEVELLDKAKGKIKVLLTSQTLVKAGDVKGQISIERIEDGTKKRVNTYDFSFKVRSSIASNESIESTNEFQIFDKIMVAGEKFKDFEDKDFDELIAAGELAKGALPKSGGTMTGDVNFSPDKGVNFTSGGTTKNNYLLKGQGTQNKIALQDKTTGKWVWEYNSDNDTFTVVSNTNVYKKTEIYGKYTAPDGRTNNINDMDLNTLFDSGIYSGQRLLNSPSGAAATDTFYYVEVSKHGSTGYSKQVATTLATLVPKVWVRTMNSTAWGAWIPQIDANGGKLSGLLTLESLAQINQDIPTTASARGFNYMEAGTQTRIGGLGLYRGSATDKPRLYLGWGANPWDWNYALTVSEDSLKYKNKDVAMRDKDGLVNLTLTADAISDDVNFPVRATRRGNTVTITGKVMLKPDATGNLITTLPEDMRPATRSSLHIPTSDGSTVFIDIQSTGTFTINTKGKAVYMTITYVVN